MLSLSLSLSVWFLLCPVRASWLSSTWHWISLSPPRIVTFFLCPLSCLLYLLYCRPLSCQQFMPTHFTERDARLPAISPTRWHLSLWAATTAEKREQFKKEKVLSHSLKRHLSPAFGSDLVLVIEPDQLMTVNHVCRMLKGSCTTMRTPVEYRTWLSSSVTQWKVCVERK